LDRRLVRIESQNVIWIDLRHVVEFEGKIRKLGEIKKLILSQG